MSEELYKIVPAAEVIAQNPPKRKKFSYSRIDGKDWVTVKWGGGDYDIELSRIPTPLALLQWLAHMGEKEWPDMTSVEVRKFILSVCQKKKWDLWGKSY